MLNVGDSFSLSSSCCLVNIVNLSTKMFYSSIDWHKETVSSFWTAALCLVSILPIIGYFFHVGLLFSISGIVCTIEVIANIVATLYVIEAHRRVSFLIFFSAVFFPVLLIGCLIAREVFAGIALGMGLTGIVIAIIAWIKRYVDRKVLLDTDKWLEKEFGDEDRESEKNELIPKTPFMNWIALKPCMLLMSVCLAFMPRWKRS